MLRLRQRSLGTGQSYMRWLRFFAVMCARRCPANQMTAGLAQLQVVQADVADELHGFADLGDGVGAKATD